MDARAARLRVLVVLQHQHAAAAGDDEAVAVGVVRTRGAARACRCTGSTARPSRRTAGHAPVQFFAAAGEHHVLHAVPDQVGRRADAMRGGRAGGGQRIAHAADAERGGERGRHGRAHRARHHVRADRAHALVAQQVAGLDLPCAEPPPEPAITPVRGSLHLRLVQAGIGDRVAHRDVA